MRPPAYLRDRHDLIEEEHDAGFTLVEVLVTLALVATLSVVMVGMITQLRSIMTARERSDAVIEAEALAGFVEQVIRDARALPLTQNNPQRRLVMSGSSDTIAFVAASRVGSTAYGLRDVHIFLDKDSIDRVRLMQVLGTRRTGDQIEPDIVELALIDDLRFQYWQQPENLSAATAGWTDSWLEPGRLPISVSIALSITRSGHKVSAKRIVNLPAARP